MSSETEGWVPSEPAAAAQPEKVCGTAGQRCRLVVSELQWSSWTLKGTARSDDC